MTDIIWINGRFINVKDAHVSITDRGLTLGDGVFDTMLAVNGEPLMADEHGERLVRHADILDIKFSLDFTATAAALLKQNGCAQGRHAIRTTITRGPAERGLMPPASPQPTIIMQASHVGSNNAPVHALISDTFRRNQRSPLSRIKCLSYGENMLALMRAKEKGADDAIMLNGEGNVCCATTSNIFMVEGKKVITPPLDDGVLDGVMRQSIIRKQNPREEHIQVERLLKADAVFLTNSITGIRPVRKINDTSFAYIKVAGLLAA